MTPENTDTDSGSDGGSSADSDVDYDASAGVEQWRSVVEQVLEDLNVDAKYVEGVLKQMQQESGGNPEAVNDYDSNWQQGIASFGLLQTIAPTYQAYAPPGQKGKIETKVVKGKAQKYVPEMVVPYNNIYAGVNYAISRYGMGKLDAWNKGQNQAYSVGAWRITKDEQAQLHEGEMVIPSSIARSFRQAMAESQAGISAKSEMPDKIVLEVNVLGATEEEGRRLARIVRDELQSLTRESQLTGR